MTQPQAVRVGFITQNHFPRLGGMEFATHFLADALSKLPDTKVAVACSTMREVPKDFPYPYPTYRPKSFSFFTPYLSKKNIVRMIRREGINILHGQNLHGGGRMAVNIAKTLKLPVVIASHGSDVQHIPEINRGARLNPKFKAQIEHSCQHADRIVVLSKMNRDLAREVGAPDDKIAIVPNGTLYEEIGAISYEDVRSKFGIRPEDFVIITVGRNSPIKRMDLLYSALALINKENPQIKCISVGPKNNLIRLVEEYGVENSVVLTGPIPAESTGFLSAPPYQDLINLYRGADLFVSVSFVESFNMSALDALACGVPVLISRNQGIRDVIKERETGFILENETPEDLAELLLRISQRKDELMRLKPVIRKSISHLSWINVAKRLRKIYRSLLI